MKNWLCGPHGESELSVVSQYFQHIRYPFRKSLLVPVHVDSLPLTWSSD